VGVRGGVWASVCGVCVGVRVCGCVCVGNRISNTTKLSPSFISIFIFHYYSNNTKMNG
jgi:hypothetical protein